MKILASLLLFLSAQTFAAIEFRTYQLTDNSYYRFTQQSFDPLLPLSVTESSLSGILLVTIDDLNSGGNNYSIQIDYSNILINGSSFGRATETLSTDNTGYTSGQLIAGWNGEPDYSGFGNSTHSPFPSLCVECSYQIKLDLNANPFSGDPLVLSYDEYNPYYTGQVNFSLFVSEVPLPSAIWFFSSSLTLFLFRKNSKL